MLRGHDSFQPEANITSTVRAFLTLTSLVRSEGIVEENPPSDPFRRAVDLAFFIRCTEPPSSYGRAPCETTGASGPSIVIRWGERKEVKPAKATS